MPLLIDTPERSLCVTVEWDGCYDEPAQPSPHKWYLFSWYDKQIAGPWVFNGVRVFLPFGTNFAWRDFGAMLTEGELRAAAVLEGMGL